MTEQTESRALLALRDLIESGRPLAYVHTAEERRITALCREAAQKYFTPAAPLWIWSLTDGLRRDGSDKSEPEPGTKDATMSPRGALEFVLRVEPHAFVDGLVENLATAGIFGVNLQTVGPVFEVDGELAAHAGSDASNLRNSLPKTLDVFDHKADS
jgi:hypothetical protein